MNRYTSHDTDQSGPHVWDQEREEAALFPTIRDADLARNLLNGGGIARDAYEWQADRLGGVETDTLVSVAPQKRGILSDEDRARIVAALDARDAADAELHDAIRVAAKNGASVRMMAESLEVSTNTISRWKRTRPEGVAADRESSSR